MYCIVVFLRRNKNKREVPFSGNSIRPSKFSLFSYIQDVYLVVIKTYRCTLLYARGWDTKIGSHITNLHIYMPGMAVN